MSHNTLAPASRNSFTDEALRFARNPIGYMIPDQYEQTAAEITADILPGTGHQRGYNRMVEAMSRETDRPIRNILNKAEAGLEGAGLVADFIPGLKAAGVAAGSILPWMMRGQKNMNRGKFGQGGMVAGKGNMVVAARMPDGEILTGKPGQVHFQLMEDERLLSGTAEMGFADESGKFLTREEAMDYARSLYGGVRPHTRGMEDLLSGEQLKEATGFDDIKTMPFSAEKLNDMTILSRNGEKVGPTTEKIHLGSYSGQHNLEIVSKDANGNVIGKVSYTEFEGIPQISHIEVAEGHRGKGVASGLIEAMTKKSNQYDTAYDYADIDWGYMTPDGVKLKAAMDKRYKP